MSETTIKRYNQRAEKYEQRWVKYLEHTHHKLLEHLETTPEDIILDASGGTGLLLQKMIAQDLPFTQFVVNDPSDNMLNIARQRFQSHPGVEFNNEKVQQLSYPKNYFDKIVCLNAFHFYRDQQQVLDHFYNILKSDGQLYILDWNRKGLFKFVNQLLDWTSSEFIDTRSFTEMKELLIKSNFMIKTSKQWNWRYWKFFLIKAEKD
ncbi:class I SAM-dependent methyltransferase [Fodinibius sp. Rm-B-1B1-1]|uniref:class I SAM-dependent methyltransferase n=1 Tax=Fodinibius alkaliphilus TaxID=3140241 RepID=UPI003159FB03